MTRRPVLILVAAATVVAIGAIAARRLANRPAAGTARTPPLLVLDEQQVDFGQVWETDEFEWHVPVRNASCEPTRVRAASGSCGCVASGQPEATVPSGTSARVPIRIDLRNTCGLAADQHVREFKTDVFLVANPGPGQEAYPVTLRGRVKAAVRLPVLAVDLGRVWVDAPPTERVIPVRFLTSLRDVTLTVQGTGLTASFGLAADAGGGEMTVRRSPGLVAGRYSGQLVLQPSAPAELIPAVRVPYSVEMLGDVQPDAPVVLLGPAPAGAVLGGTSTLSSFSGRPFRLSAWTAADPDGLEVVLPGAAGRALELTVRQRVTGPGDRANRLTLSGAGPDGEKFEVDVEVRYYGLGA